MPLTHNSLNQISEDNGTAFLTINGLKKSDFHTITLSTLDDLKGLETELANLTFDLKESGEIGNSPDKSVTITFKFLDNELNFGYYNGRLLGDLTRAPIDAALFKKIGFSTDDEYGIFQASCRLNVA